MNLVSHDPALLPVTKMLPSSHCIQRHCTPVFQQHLPIYNSSLPDGKSHHADKYLDKTQHPYTRASDSENLYHYNLQPDILSYPDMSSHLKMCSTSLLLTLRTGL